MSDPFVHLHVHSEYSALDGFGHPQQFVDRAKELGQTALAITDHGNVSAHKRWYDSCHEAGIKPLLGVEAYVVDDSTSKSQRGQWHITLLAKNITGYRNLLKIVTLSWEHGLYYKPRTDWSILQQFSEGLIATSSCPSGKIGKGITREGWSDGQVVAEMKKQAGLFKDYYAEVSPWDYDDGKKVATAVYRAAQSEGVPMVLTMDAHYPRPENAKIQDVMLCIQNRAKFNDPDRMKFSQQDFCLWSGNDMAEKWAKIHGARLPGLDDMILNTGKIANMVDFEFPNTSPLRFPSEEGSERLLRRWCEEGLRARKLDSDSVYRTRLEYEFGLVSSKKFEDYFLIVADLIVWAKKAGILVGPARGSSCGSLMCYLLRITEIDPLKHGLIFERFIDASRQDLPDIDIDFDAERRAEVKTYLANKYGQDRIASLPTFGTFRGKLCLQDIGRVFSIPNEAVEDCKRLVIQRSSADSRFGATIEDTFTNFEQAANWLEKYPELAMAQQLEGQIRQTGVHAAGIVISNEPIGNFAAMYLTPSKERVISMDYHDATSVGLLKIDLLGLKALTIIKRAAKMIKENYGTTIDINSIRLDDPTVYQSFCNQLLEGIFQFEGRSTRQVCRQVKPDNFEQLVAVNALSRPGPLHSGGLGDYVARRCGKQEATPLHPTLDEITKENYGITIYQEQVMQIVRKMGKFDWSGIATIRKMMSKKWGDEAFGAMEKRFVEGANSQGISSEDASRVWKAICTFGSMAFNKAHSVAYSVVAYQTMWLKVYYPHEFYAATLGLEDDELVRARLLREYKTSFGLPLCVDVNKSGASATSSGGGLRLGLNAVIGLGDKAVEKLIANRPYKTFDDFCRRSGLPRSKADVLLKIGAFRDFTTLSDQPDIFGDSDVYKNPKEDDLVKFCPSMSENKSCRVARDWLACQTKDRCFRIAELYDITTKTDVVIVGRSNPATDFNAKNKHEVAQSKGDVFSPKQGEEHLTKNDYNFLNFDTSDETETIISRIGYKLYPKFKNMIWDIRPTDVLGVRGAVLGEMRMVFVYNVVNLTRLQDKIAKKEKLTKEEADFINPPKRKKYARN
jgi:DNA polymerase-3 subunit alpha